MNTNNIDQLGQLTAVLQDISHLGERFVLSFEKIAESLANIDDTYKKQVGKQFPERVGEIRDAIISRVPTEEDRIREAQGASSKPIGQWLDLEEGEEEDIGIREREWLHRNAGPEEAA